MTTDQLPGTGLRFDHDPRNDMHPMRMHLPPLSETKQTRSAEKWWDFGFPSLNQGSTGTCVGHAGKHWMLCEPVVQTQPQDNPTAFDLYNGACDNDGISGNDNHDPNYGTTTNGLMKYLRSLGLISGWAWARSIDDILDWIDLKGPHFVGANWHRDMYYPDSEGFVHPTGDVVGGHEWIVRAFFQHPTRGLTLRCRNSWGSGWGIDGEFNITAVDLTQIVFGESGDAAGALEIDLRPPEPVDPTIPPTYVYSYQGFLDGKFTYKEEFSFPQGNGPANPVPGPNVSHSPLRWDAARNGWVSDTFFWKHW